jgi:hypothetical protein
MPCLYNPRSPWQAQAGERAPSRVQFRTARARTLDAWRDNGQSLRNPSSSRQAFVLAWPAHNKSGRAFLFGSDQGVTCSSQQRFYLLWLFGMPSRGLNTGQVKGRIVPGAVKSSGSWTRRDGPQRQEFGIIFALIISAHCAQ